MSSKKPILSPLREALIVVILSVTTAAIVLAAWQAILAAVRR